MLWLVLKERGVWRAERAYKAITVVTGLTTVYCNTPSLHLSSNTLQKKTKFEFELDFNPVNDGIVTLPPNFPQKV